MSSSESEREAYQQSIPSEWHRESTSKTRGEIEELLKIVALPVPEKLTYTNEDLAGL